MNIQTLLVIGLGGFLGSIGRYSLGYGFVKWGLTQFPWATLAVNLVGSFLLGIVFGFFLQNEHYPEHYKFFFATGFLGSFTTFSTFSFETMEMFHNQLYLQGTLYSLGSIVIGGLLAFAGYSWVK